MPLHTHPPASGGGPWIDPEIWKPTRPSDGLLDPPLRSRSASTGFMVEDGRLIGFASRPEKYAGEAFSLDSDITHFVEQYPRVPYRDGKTIRHHTFDFYTVRKPGIRTCVAIKHSSRVEKSGIREVLKLIAAQAGRKVADEIVLMTEVAPVCVWKIRVGSQTPHPFPAGIRSPATEPRTDRRLLESSRPARRNPA